MPIDRRTSYDVVFKLKVIARFAVLQNARATAREFGIRDKQVRFWVKAKDKLSTIKPTARRLEGGGRKVHSSEMDANMAEWVDQQRKEGRAVTGNMLQLQAKKMSHDPAFKASTGWLEHFKRRHSLHTRQNRKTSRAQRMSQDHEDENSPEESDGTDLEESTPPITAVDMDPDSECKTGSPEPSDSKPEPQDMLLGQIKVEIPVNSDELNPLTGNVNDEADDNCLESVVIDGLIMTCEDETIEDPHLGASLKCEIIEDPDQSVSMKCEPIDEPHLRVSLKCNEDAITADSLSKPATVGSEADGQIPRLEGSPGTDSPPQEDGQIFICEICGGEYTGEVFLINHKKVDHKMPIEMSLTHLPGHKTCRNCCKHLSQSVQQNIAVFLTKPCKTCISAKCYSCEMCKSHFYFSDYFQTALGMWMLNANTEPPRNSTLPTNPTKRQKQKKDKASKNPTKRQRQKKDKEIMTETKDKADVKLKTEIEDVAKFSETPVEKTPKLRKKRRRKVPERLLCSLCGKTFSKIDGLKHHLMRHSGERPFVCDACDKSFLSQAALTQHQRQHTGETPYTCEQCGRGFAGASSLHYHSQTHTGSKQFQCDQCPSAFYRNADLQYHIGRHKNPGSDSVKRHKCGVCHKRFSHPDHLRAHKVTHTGEYPYQCDTCGNSYSSKPHLKNHIDSIHTKRTLPCSECDRMFPSHAKLKRHRRICHAPEKTFKCEKCDKAFFYQRNLSNHMYRHTGKSPHVCDHCGRGFSTGTYCRAHQKKCGKKKSV